MTCSPVTKQSNGQATTDRPGNPNVWYIWAGYPALDLSNPPQMPNSDNENDSTQPGKSCGWDGWHRCASPAQRRSSRRTASATTTMTPVTTLAGVLVGLTLMGHSVPVGPRNAPAVRYVPLSRAILPSGAIWQVLVHPSKPTARMDPIHPAIQAIPTFGTCGTV